MLIREWNGEREDYPWDLLLLADPSRTIVEEYCKRGICRIGEFEGRTIAVYVLIRTRPETLELVNVSVAEEFQGKGIGKRLVLDSVEKAKELGAKSVELGTGNSSVNQLALYQKCGFRITGIDADFFTRHYPEPIYENGIRCTDMIRLRLDL
ncbi:GNAT family N-acetyltransferase [Leptospira gomenensis]|uniref:GNAT family N-acetyltransferase n=2 Tax=Leptospira gomenensis TaxID=2484974 RepID=A0A5F1YAG6_9LEPT|nr:GNAT family N-acetyltransferase [Leptospira gomenensis]TGK44012.1 GNAT family N-acetyltransferase [Leptospira gomenensis]TGK48973.1 GNAT family N-acetyltransferase [Leptospira gomenensis]TGK54683.1 GNAT family N-acetyltransferase [Leptospira gomenensis]